jgi:nucleoside-triphosphatase THEP1
MPEPEPSGSPTIPPSVQASLHAVAEVLRDPHPLSTEAREALAALVDELGNLLSAPGAPPEAVTHLADSTAQLVQAVHRHAHEGMLAAARDRLEQAILGVEVDAPVVAGVARRVLDALAGIGI